MKFQNYQIEKANRDYDRMKEKAVILLGCFSGYGHDMVQAQTIEEYAKGIHKWVCTRCATLVTVDESRRLEARKPDRDEEL